MKGDIKTISFFVPGLPKAKQYKQTKFGVIYNKGTVVAWEKTVAMAAMVAAGPGWKKVFAPISLRLYFYFPIPKTRKELVHYGPHLQDPDATNLLKAAEDGIKKVLIADDNLVYEINVSKRWADKGKEGMQAFVSFMENSDGV